MDFFGAGSPGLPPCRREKSVPAATAQPGSHSGLNLISKAVFAQATFAQAAIKFEVKWVAGR